MRAFQPCHTNNLTLRGFLIFLEIEKEAGPKFASYGLNWQYAFQSSWTAV